MLPAKAYASMTVIEGRKPRLSQQIGRYRFDPLGLRRFAFAYPVQRRDTSEDWRLDEKLERLRRYVV